MIFRRGHTLYATGCVFTESETGYRLVVPNLNGYVVRGFMIFGCVRFKKCYLVHVVHGGL